MPDINIIQYLAIKALFREENIDLRRGNIVL